MGIINEMIRQDAFNDKAIDIAKKMLKRGTPVEIVIEDTELDEATVLSLQEELGIA